MAPFRPYFGSLDNQSNLAYYIVCNHILNLKIVEIRQKFPVVLDRYFFTTVAYHSAKLGKNIDYILDRMTTLPDRIYYLTGDISELENRTRTTGQVNDRFHGVGLWEEVDKNYRRLFSHNPNVLVVDTTNRTIDQVYNQILTDVHKKKVRPVGLSTVPVPCG